MARIYEEAIEEKNQLVLLKIKNIKERRKNEEPNVKDIALLINKVREEHFKLISQSWIYNLLPKKYRHENKKEEQPKLDEISDKELYVMKDDLIRRIKDMERGPAQDIKVKETKEDIERYNFECFIAGELAKRYKDSFFKILIIRKNMIQNYALKLVSTLNQQETVDLLQPKWNMKH